MTLYVDGKLIQSCSTLTYPRARDLEGCVARRLTVNPSTTHHAYFCGQIGVMYCLEGAWDVSFNVRNYYFILGLVDLPKEATCTKMYTQGSLFANHPRTIGIENKEFLVIRPDPSTAIHRAATPTASVTSLPPSPTSPATPPWDDVSPNLFPFNSL